MIAHIRDTDNTEQSVQQHCQNTADYAQRYAEPIGMPHTAHLAGLLHDIGKCSTAFQAYIRNESDARRGEIDHSFAGAKYLRLRTEASDQQMQRLTAELIGRVILSHHGLHDWIDGDAKDVYLQRTDKDNDYSEILGNAEKTGLLSDADRELPDAADEFDAVIRRVKQMTETADRSRRCEARAFYLGMTERFLQSVLIDADRTDTADFMSDAVTEAQFDTQAVWQRMQKRMDETLSGFRQKTDPISKQRQSISDRCAAFAEHDVKICKLIVPTGGGKSLSSLRFAIRYAQRLHMEKIIYIAPFMSILEQNSDVIRAIAGDECFLEHHSNMLAEQSADGERLREYELRSEKWDQPVIATTMVQLLNALFSGKSAAVRRMHRLSRAVIIVDEVQSVPLKCVYLFNLAMNFLSHVCGSAVVLCSATQPPFEQLKEFPLLLDAESSMTGDATEDFAVFRRTRLHYLGQKGGYSYDQAAELCREWFRENGSLLCVVNTKKAAQEMWQRLRETPGAEVFHLSTAMCPKHRRSCIAAIRAKLSEHAPVVCVTTQLIEAGVDISFGCVMRSLAGMENAVQAAGRCNRNGEYPSACPVYVLHLYEEKLGSLHEIKDAQGISRAIFDQPADTDFLSVPVMRAYFGKLYQQCECGSNGKNRLRYPLNDRIDRDLINLLALNDARVKYNGSKRLTYCGQAFKTAGMKFEVIDTHTRDVIVPYDTEAEQLLQELEHARTPREAAKLLRQLQAYTVSVYSGTDRQLEENRALRSVSCGGSPECSVTVLERRFYDDTLGVRTEGGAHEFLCL